MNNRRTSSLIKPHHHHHPRSNGCSISMLKFSNTSVSSARATHAALAHRYSMDNNNNNNENGLLNNGKRRRFFNSSTELFPILGLMLMSI